jgi:hypothetical protein
VENDTSEKETIENTAALFTGLLRGEIMSIVGNSSSIFDKIGFSIVSFSLVSFSTESTSIKSSTFIRLVQKTKLVQKNPSKVKKMKKEKDYQQGRVRKKERKRRANNKLFP